MAEAKSVEIHRIQVPCHMLLLVHFVSSSHNLAQEILEPFMLPSGAKFYGDTDFIGSGSHWKKSQYLFNDYRITVYG